MDKRRIEAYTGSLSQIAGVKDYRLNTGKAYDVRCLDVRNGTGLEFTVIADRGFDIGQLSYKGTNISFLSKTGITAPQYFSENGALGFLRSFYAGFLTTCGLTYFGRPCADEGQSLGLHGQISNIPADNVNVKTEWENGLPVIRLEGKVRQSCVFGENLLLKREIKCKYGEKKFYITDEIANEGFRDEPFMALYHINFGYPFLSKDTRICAPIKRLIPRDEEAAKGKNCYDTMSEPANGFKEQVFYCKLHGDAQGDTSVLVSNSGLKLAVLLRFNIDQLNWVAIWKSMAEGDYALGIEPCNSHGRGRAAAKEDGILHYIKAGETKQHEICVEILDIPEEIELFENSLTEIAEQKISD